MGVLKDDRAPGCRDSAAQTLGLTPCEFASSRIGAPGPGVPMAVPALRPHIFSVRLSLSGLSFSRVWADARFPLYLDVASVFPACPFSTGSRSRNRGPWTLQGALHRVAGARAGAGMGVSAQSSLLASRVLESRRVTVPRARLCLHVRSMGRFRGLLVPLCGAPCVFFVCPLLGPPTAGAHFCPP